MYTVVIERRWPAFTKDLTRIIINQLYKAIKTIQSNLLFVYTVGKYNHTVFLIAHYHYHLYCTV